MEIRFATADDIPTLARISADALAEVGPEMFFPDTDEALAEAIGGDGWAVIAEADGRVVAYQLVVVAGRVAHMETAVVVPAWRGCGIQRILVEEALGEIDRRDLGPTLSAAAPSNAASIRSLERAGFRQTGRELRYGGRERIVLRRD